MHPCFLIRWPSLPDHLWTPAVVLAILQDLEGVRAHALRRDGVAPPLGVNCITWTVMEMRRGCVTLRDVVAGVVVRACALGAQTGLPGPAPVAAVAAGSGEDWEVLMSAVACFFSWLPSAT